MKEEDRNPDKIVVGRSIVFAVGFLLMNGAVLYFANEIILDQGWNQRYLLISGLLSLLIIAYAFAERKRLFPNMVCLIFILICFLLSAMLLLLPDVYVNVPVWLFGGILTAALLNRNMGMLYVYYFVLQAIYLQAGSIRGLILHFVVATILCIIIPFMKKWLSMLYVMVVTCATIVCMSIFINELKFETDMILDVAGILGIYLVCILVTMILRYVLYKPLHQEKEQGQSSQPNEDLHKGYEYLSLVATQTNDSLGDITKINLQVDNSKNQMLVDTSDSDQVTADAIVTTSADTATQQEVKFDFSEYCNEDSDLMQQLKAKKKSAFVHSLLVGKLSSEAAEAIGAREEFAKAIGFYHEIGKINEGNCSEQTVQIAKEHQFPELLLSALSECNSPNTMESTSKEAAIVMLTDTILATYFYLRNNKNVTTTSEKIVDNAIGLRITRGKLNCSGLSVADCASLREYFVDQLKTQDKRRGILS